jgi:hypothetical protein
MSSSRAASVIGTTAPLSLCILVHFCSTHSAAPLLYSRSLGPWRTSTLAIFRADVKPYTSTTLGSHSSRTFGGGRGGRGSRRVGG